MKQLNGILYIEHAEAVEAGFPEGTLKSARQRTSPSWEFLPDPIDRRRVLIRYDKLKSNYQTLIKQYCCRLHGCTCKESCSGIAPDTYLGILQKQEEAEQKAVTTASLPALIQINISEEDTLLAKGMDTTLAEGYARAAAWLRLISTAKPGALGYTNKPELIAAAILNIQQEKLPNFDINSEKVLYRKLSAYKKEGITALVSKKIGNTNRNKLQGYPEREAVAFKYASDGHKPSLPVIAMLYNREAELRGWPLVEEQTIFNYISRKDVKQAIFMARHGVKEHYKKYDTNIKQRRALPDDKWVIDGSPVQLAYHHNGKLCTDLYLFIVMDSASYKVLGYDISHSEDASTVFRAFKMACWNTGHMPHQIQYDNSSAIKQKHITALREVLAKYNTPCAPYKPKSKPIELMTGLLQTQVFRYFDNNTGQNLTARSLDSRVNPEFKKEVVLASKAEAIQQTHIALAVWDAHEIRKFKASPAELYAQGSPRRRPFGEHAFVNTFWLRKPDYPYTQSHISFTVAKHTYTYWVDDANFWAQHIGSRFDIMYDPGNMESIYLMQEGRFVAKAKLWDDMPSAIADARPGELSELNRRKGLKKEQEQIVMSQRDAIRQLADAQGIQRLSVETVHKDAWNKAEQALIENELKQIGMGKAIAITEVNKEENTEAAPSLYNVTATRKAIKPINND